MQNAIGACAPMAFCIMIADILLFMSKKISISLAYVNQSHYLCHIVE